MSRMSSGRVRTRFSLQPSSSGPPKSAAFSFFAWMSVPIAPSSTRMRSERVSRSRWMRCSVDALIASPR